MMEQKDDATALYMLKRTVVPPMSQAYDSVMSALDPKYQGFEENPDQ